MKPLLRRDIHPKATVPDASEGPIIEFRSSDETLDRYNERITVSGWKLDNYRKNPVVQNAHNYCSVSDTIGKSLITEIRSSSTPERGLQSAATLHAPTLSRSTLNSATPYLFQRVLFAVEENPMAKVAYGLYKGGFLSAVSVGFIPLNWENGSQEDAYRRNYLQQELIEVSAVSIPANPNALVLGVKSGAVEMADLKELFQLLKHFCTSGSAGVPPASTQPSTQNPINHQPTNPAGRRSTTSALGPASDEARLLHLKKQMDEIRAILKRA